MEIFRNIIFLFLLIYVFHSCKKDNKLQQEDVKVNRTVLIYMEANNDLKYEALSSINSMERGYSNPKDNLLVYIKTEDNVSHILKIHHDNLHNKITSDTVHTIYDDIPSNPLNLLNSINFVKDNYPSNSFGLVLWSHATSWAPPFNQIKLKSFGRDREVEMDIFDLKNVLPNNMDFIIFDACSMSSIEVLYEFKLKAKFILSSPTETLAESYPYHKIVPDLFSSLDKLERVAKTYYDHYNSLSGKLRSASISLIKTDELNDLAYQMKQNIEKNINMKLSTEGVQRLDFSIDFPIPIYDFKDFLFKNYMSSDLNLLMNQLDKTVIYKISTDFFIGNPINVFSGIGCYIPNVDDEYFFYYKKFSWYYDSGISLIVE